MSSSFGASSNATQYTAAQEPVAPRTQFVRRGFRGERDTAAATLGAIVRLPPKTQAVLRHKLIAIIMLQVFAISVALAVVEFGSDTLQSWIDTHVAHQSSALVAVGAVTLALLLLLLLVRHSHPLNWVALVLFTAAQALGLLVYLASRAHVVLRNCVLTWFSTVLMMCTAGWTHNNNGGCGGIAFAWRPSNECYDNVLRDDDKRRLLSPYVTGPLVFVVASALALLLSTSQPFGIEWSQSDMEISIVVQAFVGCWLVYEVDRMHRKMAPDTYMYGVINLYADFVAVAVGIVVLAGTCLCVLGNEGEATSVVDLAERGTAGCCRCLDNAARQAHEQEY